VSRGGQIDGQSYRQITDDELVERARRLGAGGSGRDSEVIEA